MLPKKYFENGFELFTRLQNTQVENIERAAEIISQAVAGGYTFYTWGRPHSLLPFTDMFWRAGRLDIVTAVFTMGFCLEIGPLRPTSFLERVEGYGRDFFNLLAPKPGMLSCWFQPPDEMPSRSKWRWQPKRLVYE